MPTRDEVISAVRARRDYFAAAGDLHVPAGQAYMVATGQPADGSDAYPPEEAHGELILSGSTQVLVYHDAAAENPVTKSHVHAWLKRRAAQDAQMRSAAAGRDAAPGEPEDTDETDIASVLTRDHDQVTAMLKELKTIPGVTGGGDAVHQSRRESLVDMITVALSQHEATEEKLFWPAVRSSLPDGDALAETALAQEQEGKDVLTALGKLAASEDEFDELCEKLDLLARKHVAFEDRVLLALRAQLSLEDRRRLGERFAHAEGRAPTRPHPHAPQHPGAAVAAAGMAGSALDHVRDAVGSRPAKRRGRAEKDIEEEQEG